MTVHPRLYTGGREAGAVRAGPYGVALQSTAGDFAEYHRLGPADAARPPDATGARLAEGDLVALVGGLTCRAAASGAPIVGVVRRLGAAGSRCLSSAHPLHS
jgi:hypothetical protein